KLKYLEEWTEARRRHAASYAKMLAGTELVLPSERAHDRNVCHVYAVRSSRRDEFMQSLQAKGVQTGIHYPKPVHLLPAYAELGYRKGDFPVTERLADEEVSLPMFPELTETEIAAVSQAITESALTYI